MSHQGEMENNLSLPGAPSPRRGEVPDIGYTFWSSNSTIWTNEANDLSHHRLEIIGPTWWHQEAYNLTPQLSNILINMYLWVGENQVVIWIGGSSESEALYFPQAAIRIFVWVEV